MQGLSQLKCTSGNLSDTSREQQGKVVKLGQESHQSECQAEGMSKKLLVSENSSRSNASKLEENHATIEGMTHDDAVGLCDRGNGDIMIRVGRNDEFSEPPTGAIDLIGSFDNRPEGTFGLSSSADGPNNVGKVPQVRYSNKSLQPNFPTLAGNRAAMKEHDCKSGQHLENTNGISQAHVVTLSDCKETTPVMGQSELTFPSSQIGPIPVPRVRSDDMYTGCNNVSQHVYHAQPGLPPAWSPKPAGQREYSPFPMSTSVHSTPDVNDSEQVYHRSDEVTNCSIDHNDREQDKQEPVGEQRCSSPTADQSACSSLCNGGGNHENSSVHGGVSSRSDASASASASANFAAAIDKGTTTENFNDSNFFIHEGLKGMDSHRSSQREAALTKFRLKRKDRCFEKKVRYQSRKRLAEQRPRVRGQFVRQVQNDTPVGDADGSKL
ncbi:hypothetical protein COLO4_23051 [Corchorus olitorius]|uniref:CCT domain-containing protein n=1 Tax=Corchorus olitorius TaxID=93759 RepID=A0A1R3III1_9ROSI|nr:hypothetical protein COLO4_23051 [Corchorus olitorius]